MTTPDSTTAKKALTLKVQDNCHPHEGRGDYLFGDKPTLFLRTDWTLEQVRGLLRAGNEPISALPIASWEALGRLLPAATKELAAMREKCEYQDVYAQKFNTSLIPMMLVSYNMADHVAEDDGRRWMVISEDELNESFDSKAENRSYSDAVGVGRIQQVLLGSGYTSSCLPSDGDSNIEWQFAELTNGDLLLFAGYEWFNK